MSGVLFSSRAGVGLLELDRPAVLNALDRRMYEALQARLATVVEDGEVRVLIVAGRGRAFCSGTDLSELAGASRVSARALGLLENRVCSQLEDFPRPTIAAIHGYALGGGCELALACDLRLAADDAILGQPEIDMGWLPAAGATFRLPALVGPARARELIFTGRRVGAGEALRMGLVNQVVPAADLVSEAMRLARDLSTKDPEVLRRAREVLRSSFRDEAMRREADDLAALATRPAAQRRIAAFLARKDDSAPNP